MSAQDWALVLPIVVLCTAFAARLGRFSVTMPRVLVLAGAVIGPGALGFLNASVRGRRHGAHHRDHPGPAVVRRRRHA